MGKSQRVKGHSWERECARRFRAIGFPKAARLLEYQEGLGVDLSCTDPFLIQCKAGKIPPRVLKTLKEVPESDTHYPVAIMKQDRERPYVGMYLDDFLEIIEMLKANKVI